MFVYESVPGSTVENFKETDTEVEFTVSAPEDVQLHWNLSRRANMKYLSPESLQVRWEQT